MVEVVSELTPGEAPPSRSCPRLDLVGRRSHKLGPVAALAAAIALFMLLVAAPADIGDISSWLQRITLVLTWLTDMLLVSFIGTAVHEAGHALAGRLVGFRFVACRVGPITMTRTQRGIRIGPSTDSVFGGYANCLPMVGGRLRARYAVFVIGGPLATFAWIIGLVALALTLPIILDPLAMVVNSHVGSDPSTDVVAISASVTAWMNVVLWVVALPTCIIPMPVRGKANDALLLVRALRGGARFERTLALAGMRTWLAQEMRPRAWSESLVADALALVDKTSEHVGAVLYAYAWAHDRSEIERAGEYLNQLLAYSRDTPPWTHISPTFALECAYFMARHRDDPAAARQWLEHGEGGTVASFMRPRALAAILLAEDKPEEALVIAEQGLAGLSQATAELQRSGADGHGALEDLRAMIDQARLALVGAP